MATDTPTEVWVLKRLTLAELESVAVARGLSVVRRSDEEVVLRAKDGSQIAGVEHRRSGLRYLAVPDVRRQWDPTLLTIVTEFGQNRIGPLSRAEAPLLLDEEKCALALPLAVSFPVEDVRATEALRALYKHGSRQVRQTVLKALDHVDWPSAAKLIEELAQLPPEDLSNPFEAEARTLRFVEIPREALAIVEQKRVVLVYDARKLRTLLPAR